MSAFICSDLHFSVVATITVPNGVELQAWADYLKKINIQSVNYRYKERTKYSKCKLHEYEDEKYSVHDMANIIGCYLYQSCEKETMEFTVLDAYLRTFIKVNSFDNKSIVWSI